MQYIILVLLLSGCVTIGCSNKSVLKENQSLKQQAVDLQSQLRKEQSKNETMRRWWATHMKNLRDAINHAEEK